MGPNATGVLEPLVTTMVSMLIFNQTEEDPGSSLNQSTTALPTSTNFPYSTTLSPVSSQSPAPCGTEPAFPSNYGIRDVIRMRGMENGEGLECSGWLPINHIYFQLANIFLFLSYLAPNGIYGILYLRITLTIGCMFFSLWGWVILCAFDTFLWNAIFVLINLVHVVIICYYLRPVRFTPELEQVSRTFVLPVTCLCYLVGKGSWV